MKQFTFRFIAVLLVLGAASLEFYGIGRGQSGLTWTSLLRQMRFDPIAGPCLIVFWTWLTFHVFFNPRWLGGATGWRDLALYVPAGIILAIVARLR